MASKPVEILKDQNSFYKDFKRFISSMRLSVLSLLFVICFGRIAYAEDPSTIPPRVSLIYDDSLYNYKPDSVIDRVWNQGASEWNSSVKRTFVYSTQGQPLEVITSRWDEVLEAWANVVKLDYTLDVNGNVTAYLFSDWKVAQRAWINHKKYESTYNNQRKATSLQEYDWDELESEWHHISDEQFDYDENGYLIEYKRQFLDEFDQVWVPSKYFETTYDANGHKLTHIDYKWDDVELAWFRRSKDEWTYNEAGDVTQLITYGWNLDELVWFEIQKSERQYDDQNRLVAETKFTWDDSSEDWGSESKREYTFDDAGNLTLEVDYDWDPDNNEWSKADQYVRTYDAQGRKTEEVRSGIGLSLIANPPFENRFKAEYEYEDGTEPTLIHEYLWDSDSEEWYDLRRTEATYTEKGQLIDRQKYFLTDDVWSGMFRTTVEGPDDGNTINIISHDWVSDDWVYETSKTFYFGEDVNVHIPDNPVMSVEVPSSCQGVVYPNPLRDQPLTIFGFTSSHATFKLFDLQGKLLQTYDTAPNEQLDLGQLKTGYYIYHLISGTEKIRGVLVKQ